MAMEETRRRNEASMARKRNANNINPAAANSGPASPEGPLSPTSTGAMDSLLEKLRAAAPQARDQRDRRRRARLKDKHEVRIASGQKIPDLSELTAKGSETSDSERGLMSPDSVLSDIQEKDSTAAKSEGEDVADRAASLLQGLRGDGDGDGDGVGRDGSLRVRRRRENADDERRNRRRRRAANGVTNERDGALSPTKEGPSPIQEEFIPQENREQSGTNENNEDGRHLTPTTVVSPPSPEGTARKPVEIPD